MCASYFELVVVVTIDAPHLIISSTLVVAPYTRFIAPLADLLLVSVRGETKITSVLALAFFGHQVARVDSALPALCTELPPFSVNIALPTRILTL